MTELQQKTIDFYTAILGWELWTALEPNGNLVVANSEQHYIDGHFHRLDPDGKMIKD